MSSLLLLLLLLWACQQPPAQVPADSPDLPLLDRLAESGDQLSYMEPDLAETNPIAFAQKLQVCRERPA